MNHTMIARRPIYLFYHRITYILSYFRLNCIEKHIKSYIYHWQPNLSILVHLHTIAYQNVSDKLAFDSMSLMDSLWCIEASSTTQFHLLPSWKNAKSYKWKKKIPVGLRRNKRKHLIQTNDFIYFEWKYSLNSVRLVLAIAKTCTSY